MRFQKRVISVLLCLAMVLTFMPATAFAEGYADLSQISVVNLTGAKDILTAGKAADYYFAVPISNGGDSRYTIGGVGCYEAFDFYRLQKNDPLEPGVEYFLSISLIPSEGYTFSVDEEDISVTVDGTPIEVECLESTTSASMQDAYRLYVKYYFTTEGTPVEYLTDISMTVNQAPMAWATPLTGSALCTLPKDVPYVVTSAHYMYKNANNSWSATKNFGESESFALWVDFEWTEPGYRFAEENKTTLHLSGVTGYTSFGVGRSENGGRLHLYGFSVDVPPVYTISYDPCGGQFPDGKTEVFTARNRPDGTLSYLFSEMEKEGYNFTGWYTAPTGGEKVTGDSKFSGPATVYAQWTPCISTVEIENLMRPVAGKTPTFTATVPADAAYKITGQTWSLEQEDAEQMVTDSAVKNKILKKMGEQYGRDVLLTSFDGSKVYEYTVQLTSTGDLEFAKNTQVVIGSQKLTANGYGKELEIHVTYDCAAAKALEVYDGASVASGLCNTATEAVDLQNYVRSVGSCTMEAEAMPSWLTLSSSGVLTGTRPATAQAATSFTVTVTDTKTSETATMTVSVGAVTTEWEIVTQPESLIQDNCEALAHFMVETTAQNPTYAWEMYDPGTKTWYPLATLAPLISLDFMSMDGLMTIGCTEGNAVDLTGCFFRCKVTANGVTKTSSQAKLTVNHAYTICEPISGNSDQHRLTCRWCGATKVEDHTFHYELIKEATETESGNYRKVCDVCGYKSNTGYTKPASGDKVVMTLDFNGADLPTSGRVALVDRLKKTRPYAFLPVRDGFVFQGWATSPTATAAVYSPNESVLAVANMTLYAVWKPVEIIVGGTPVTLDNMNDVLGDGTVSYLPPTSTHGPKVMLNGATISSKYVPVVEKYVAIYTTNPIEIVVSGEQNTLLADSGIAYGILSTADLVISGSNLEIKGDTASYAVGIQSANTQMGAGNLLIKDARIGVAGDAEFFDGWTSIEAGLCADDGYKAVSGKASLDEYFKAVVLATETDGANYEDYTETTLANAVKMRNMMVVAEETEIPEPTVISEVAVTAQTPVLGNAPDFDVTVGGEGYTATVEGWYSRPADDESAALTPITASSTFKTAENTVYVLKVRLSAQQQFVFAPLDEFLATVNEEAVSVTADGDDLILTAEMTCIDPVIRSITVTDVDVTPVAGEKAGDHMALTIPEGEHYTVYQQYWRCDSTASIMNDDEEFVEGYEYMRLVKMQADEGYTFDYDTVVSLNGVSNGSNLDAKSRNGKDIFYFWTKAAVAQKSTKPTDPTEKLLGDANNDGDVNMKDVLAIRKQLAGMSSEINLINADCNGDGDVNMKDVLAIRKFLAGLITELGA